MKRNVKIWALLATVLLSGPSCAPLPQKQSEVLPAEQTRAVVVEGLLSQTNEFVAKGDFKSALDFSKDACSKYPEEEALREGYVAAVEDIKKAADTAFDKGNYALAGRTYSLLLKKVLRADNLSSELSFTNKSLTERIAVCLTELSQKALNQYRSGNIENAISLWKSILSFDPGNKSIKKSIDTATTQLKNLRQGN